jgi:hypothetical protein
MGRKELMSTVTVKADKIFSQDAKNSGSVRNQRAINDMQVALDRINNTNCQTIPTKNNVQISKRKQA